MWIAGGDVCVDYKNGYCGSDELGGRSCVNKFILLLKGD